MRKFKILNEKEEYVSKTFRIPKHLMDKVSLLADRNNISANRLVIQCIEYALDNIEGDMEIVPQ